MEEIKPQPEATTVASSTGERVDELNAAADQLASFHASAARPRNSDPLHQLPRASHTQLSLGPRLADGYAPIGVVRPPGHQRTPVPRIRLDPSNQVPLYKKTSKPSPTLRATVEQELAEVKQAWQKYRSTNSRDAVYFYLEAVFALVRRWQRLKCSLKNSRAALSLQTNPPQMKPEPFAIAIFCTSDPRVVDAKTRSKWSRVLRYAARAKPLGQRLTDFVKSNGGINECARKFAQPVRRP
jgi:hypothetical protein